MPAPILNAYLDGNSVVAVRRNEQGVVELERHRAEWVAYLPRAAPAEVRRSLQQSRAIRSFVSEGEFIRVSFADWKTRKLLCEGRGSPLLAGGMRPLEADVDPVRRWITDSGVEVAAPRRCYLDLETDSRVPFSEKERARILTWAIVDEEGNWAQGCLERDTDDDERRLLLELWAALAPYDQVQAWNGDEFDFPVKFARSKRLSIPVNALRWLFCDHLVLFRRQNMHSGSGEEKRSFALGAIARAVLGEGKDVLDATKTWEHWHAGGESRKALLRYNLKDAGIEARLEKATGYCALFDAICRACRVPGDTRALHPTRQMDGYMLRLGKERGYRFPTKAYREGAEKYRGAYVMEPKVSGIERGVHVCDFASLYPSIILTWNMSPDTLVVDEADARPVCTAPTTKARFAVGEEGILPTALRELGRLRKVWADKKASLPPGTPEWHDADRISTAYKVVANSFYGVVGSAFSRYYSQVVAESITLTGKWLLERTIEQADARKWTSIYADTDSVFVQGCTRAEFAAFVDWLNAEHYPALVRELGCTTNTVKLAYEKAFDRIVFTSAKRYVARYEHYKGTAAKADSKPEIKGLEYKRGDAAKLARDLQAEVIDMLVGGLGKSRTPVTEDLERYHDALAAMLARVLEGDLDRDDVVLSKRLQHPLKEYARRQKKDGADAAEPAHVAVARVLEQRGLTLGEGARVEYVVVDGECTPLGVVPASDMGGEVLPDRYYLWESLVFPPTQRLLEAAFPRHDWTRWAKVRPPKLAAKYRRLEEAGQASLFAAEVPTADRIASAARRRPA